MAAPAVQAQAATAETPADAPCLCGDAAELSSSIQAEQPTAPQTAAVMRADSTLPIAMLLPAAPELRRDAAPRVPMDREPSFLGSFLI